MDHATFTSARRAILRTLALSTMSLLIACTPAWQQPVPEDEVDLLSESKTLTRDGVTVTVAVPSAEESFDADGKLKDPNQQAAIEQLGRDVAETIAKLQGK